MVPAEKSPFDYRQSDIPPFAHTSMEIALCSVSWSQLQLCFVVYQDMFKGCPVVSVGSYNKPARENKSLTGPPTVRAERIAYN